jgi:phosphoribosyl-ATP pyrophosphohydrolase/phosphoribosyl-AMP cyclohydrolase
MKQPDFSKGLLPAVVQDSLTGKILMLGYMNEEAYQKTMADGKVTFFSRSRNELWTKGKTSGHYLIFESLQVDCDADTLLIRARPQGPTCHEGTDTCWAEENAESFGFLHYLEKLIQERKAHPVEGSYTNRLFEKGTAKIAQKVGEEAVEVVIEAMSGNNELLKSESADLLYHFLVLLADRGIALNEVLEVLKKRHS